MTASISTIARAAFPYLAQALDIPEDSLRLLSDRSGDSREPSIKFNVADQRVDLTNHLRSNLAKHGRVDSFSKYERRDFTVDFRVNGTKCRIGVTADYSEEATTHTVFIMQWNPVSGDEKDALLAAANAAFIPTKHALACDSTKMFEGGGVYFSVPSKVGRASMRRLTKKYGAPATENINSVWTTATHKISVHDNGVFTYFSTEPK